MLLVINLVTPAPLNDKKDQPKIVQYKFRQLPNNGYHFIYELSDGQSRDEFASFEDGILRITGTYSYIGDDKKTYTVQYTADENGYDAKTDVQDDVEKEDPVTLSLAAIATLGTG